MQSQGTSRTESIILQLNKSGLSYLTHQQFSEAFQYFKQAEKIVNAQLQVETQNISVNKLAGITYNNLACYYKKANKPKISLIYLEKALEVEVNKVQDWSATASTHLNICAIYSHIKEHEPAANHAELALQMLQKTNNQDDETGRSRGKKFTDEEKKFIENLKMLAHYNLAIELEHLKTYERSIEEFIRARDMGKKIGKKHTGIIMVCEESIQRMQQILNNLKEKLIKLVTKKREDEQKGHYYYMRKNKRSVLGAKLQQDRQKIPSTSLAGKIKQMKIYEEKPHYRTKSIFRMKTSPKINESSFEIPQKQNERKEQRNSSFSHL